MSRQRSFITLLWLIMYSFAIPLADDDDDDDNGDDDDGDDVCGSQSNTLQPVQLAVSTTLAVRISNGPSPAILGPYERLPTPRPSSSQHLHATLPVPHQDHTPAILGTVIGIVIALVAFFVTVRGIVRRRRITADPFNDPPKSRFMAVRLGKSPATIKRLSDESWVSPTLLSLASHGSPLSQDLELRRYASLQRMLVPVTTPVCTPIDTEFGSRLEFISGDPNAVIPVPPVRVPSPVYISPFSPSPSLSPSSSLSPTPSIEPLSSPNPARLSRLLSSTFRDTIATSPTRPTTARLIQTARSYAQAYRPLSTATISLYTPPTPLARFAGTRSRTSFCLGPNDEAHPALGRARDTFSTVTTSDTDIACTVPHLRHAASRVQPSVSPFLDPGPVHGNTQTMDGTVLGQLRSAEGHAQTKTPAGTSLGLKLRLSDASEHARYRLRERERERDRRRRQEQEREAAEQRFSTDSQTSAMTTTSMETVRGVRPRSRSLEGKVEERNEFKLRDSESVLREFGW